MERICAADTWIISITILIRNPSRGWIQLHFCEEFFCELHYLGSIFEGSVPNFVLILGSEVLHLVQKEAV